MNVEKPIDTAAILYAFPGSHLIILPDTPKFTIVGATEAYLKDTHTVKEKIKGFGVFEVFPENADTQKAKGTTNILLSFQHVIEHKELHRMQEQRYDVWNPAKKQYDQKIWRPMNTPVLDQAGNVQYIIHTIEDITERVLSQEAEKNVLEKVKQSEHQLQENILAHTADLEDHTAFINSILNASLTGVVALDVIRNDSNEVVDFTISKINEQSKKILNIDESVIGQSYLSHFTSSVELGIFRMYCSVLETGEPKRTEVFSNNLNLNSWFDISAAKRNNNGIVVTFANISPQREAAKKVEEQKNLLGNILKHIPAGITVYHAIRNEEGVIVDFQCILSNDAAEKFTGIASEIRYTKTVLEITPSLKGTPLFQLAVKALDEDVPFHTEYQNPEINKWLELSVVKMFDEHLVNVFRDISPIKEAQLNLEKNIEDLKRSNTNLEEFAYAASHDLKEPIRKIHFFSDLLKNRLQNKLEADDTKVFERMELAAKE